MYTTNGCGFAKLQYSEGVVSRARLSLGRRESLARETTPSLYCNLAKPHPLVVYIVHERSSHVLSFVSLYFAVVYSDRAALDLPVLL